MCLTQHHTVYIVDAKVLFATRGIFSQDNSKILRKPQRHYHLPQEVAVQDRG